MSTRRSPSLKDDSDQSLKREQALHRSLRECTTRRLTHYNPCNVDHVHNAPTLTSRVQWSNGRSPARSPSDKVTVHAANDAIAVERDVSMSPVQSEIDELAQSNDDDQPPESSRPSTGTSSHLHPSSALRANESVGDRGCSSPSFSDSSDTERRQPNFPGNRDIIDSRFLSTSPSPPTQHSAELETPSPMSDVGNCWPSENGKPSSSLGLHLNTIDRPLLRDERLVRVGSWRTESTMQDRLYNHNQGQYGVSSAYDSPRPSYLHYSPSISSSSAPPSPPPVLPPIHHLNATLPVNTGNTPGVMHWRFRESLDARHVKKSKSGRDYPDEYTNFRSATASPQSLPPLLPHIKMMAQPYPPSRPLPGIMPVSVAPPMPSAANPTRDKNAWKDYAQLVTNENEETQFRCVWPTGYTGEMTDHCGYTAKRHLVKRHIETRHLQFKDHICPYCGKAFPQRVSLMIHVNRHTGAKPHPCRYVDCDKTFSDPARRHKHMVEAHGYNPQGPRKRHRTVDSYHTNKNFESLAPWTAKGEDQKDAVAKS